MRLETLLCLIAIAPAFAQPTAKPATPQQRAHSLLDQALEMAGGTPVAVHAFALLHIADNYREFSAAKSQELFDRSLSVAAGIESPRDRATLQSAIVKALAELDVHMAVRLVQVL